jgi:hypothetical protein
MKILNRSLKAAKCLQCLCSKLRLCSRQTPSVKYKYSFLFLMNYTRVCTVEYFVWKQYDE